MTTRPACRVIIARPRGFCAGVVRAVEIVERALETYGAPVHVRHEIVHNSHVVNELRRKGAVFVDEVSAIPPGAVTVFSAHGVARSVDEEAAERGLDVIDATCPLVRRVHNEGAGYAARGFDVILIGHAGHAEVIGTMGRIDGRVHLVGSPEDVANLVVNDPGKVAYVTQTTLSLYETAGIIAALKQRFPNIVGPETRNICYATQNRQKAVYALVREVDILLVVGSPSSSNASRLRDIGNEAGLPAYLIEDSGAIDPSWIETADTIGITAGASTPEPLVQRVLAHLASLRQIDVFEMDAPQEKVAFRLPARLSHSAAAQAAPSSSLETQPG